MTVGIFCKALLSLMQSVILLILPLRFPRIPHGRKLAPVWADEFDGDTLDATKWKGHSCNAEEASVRRGSYWNTKTAFVKDGNLHIPVTYYPEGLDGNGKPGWYTCGIDTKGLYEQKYGYFEVRCILPRGSGIWAAFWMLCDGMGNVDGSGRDGAEIDVFEAPFSAGKWDRMVSSNIHIDGYGEAHQSVNVCKAYHLLNDPYREFNTYGLEWNEKGYTFYINGVKTGRSDFGGASAVPEYLILSVEVGGENAVPGESWAEGVLSDGDTPTDFIVDYVRAYQYK